MRACVICATPRSGSTLLCSLLRSSGVAGQPESWFRRQDRADWARAWGIGPGDWDSYLAAAIVAGTGGNGVCGLRLMWNMLGELVAELGGAAVADQAALLEQIFGPTAFVHLSRRDGVAQAVSRHRAEASGIWHLGIEEAEVPGAVGYDFGRIAGYLDAVAAENVAWDGWFAANGIAPLRVFYEDLAADPGAVARLVLTHLGLEADGPLQSPVRRMADATSAAWGARFRAEMRRGAG